MSDPRKALAETIGQVLNDGRKLRDRYLIVPDERPVATLERRTVIVSLQGFEPTDAAPLSGLTVRYTLRVISPKPSMIEAELDAWDAATDVARAIDGIDGANYAEATKIRLDEKYLAYDITVTTDSLWKD